MSEPTADKLVSIYIKIRNVIKEKEDEIKRFKEQQDQVADKLLSLCNEQNVDGLKTPEGTVSRRVNSSYWTSDWEQMHKFIRDNEAFHLLEKRIHNANMREFLSDNPDLCPIGLQSNKKYIISVRKPTAK
ncbi:MAG: hypothetical protein CMA72_00940 [Euryarchaeota archaeon]|nr:hypothetical protein [Euryarchaeota archaeon]|tara:strand:- start:11 stop:400 length:390 start_codon:yes stop_codon:yes gene_type:complete